MPNDILQNYIQACNYPGVLDEAAVNAALEDYVKALGIKRSVQRLASGWRVEDCPSIMRTVEDVLVRLRPNAARKARDARAASAARKALDARAASAALDALDARAASAARDARAARDA